MKKYNLSLVFSIVFCFLITRISFSQFDVDKNKNVFKSNKVISQVVYNYGFDLNGVKKNVGEKESFIRFNSKGEIVNFIEYKEKIGIKRNTIFKYDASGKEIFVSTKNGGDTLLEEYSYQYFPDGRIKEKIGVLDGEEFSLVYIYNNQKRLIEKLRVIGKDSSWVKYEYDEKGLLSRELMKGTNAQEINYRYDDLGLLVEKEFLIDSIPLKIVRFSYNENGLKSSEDTYDTKGYLSHSYSYKYNEAHEIREVILMNYYLQYEQNKWVYKYGELGLIEEIITYDSGDKTPVYSTNYLYKLPVKK